MTNKKSYVEPKDAPPGVPCRFCDMPAGTDGLGPVYQDGVAIDKKRPLFSHAYCLMNSGGVKQDDQDFSLQNLLPNTLKNASGPGSDIWDFSFKNRFIAHPEPNNLTKTKRPPEVEPIVRMNKSEEYEGDDTGAPNPPSK